MFILIITACCYTVSAWGSSEHFIRAASDPVENLIYPQQISVCGNGNYHILDTVSNSAHIKIYSPDGEFLSGIIPAGAGKDTAKFDLGLTVLSGKKIFDVDKEGHIYLFDNEDSLYSLKQFDQRGSLTDTKYLGYPEIIDSYGAVALSADFFFVEFNDEIYRGRKPLGSEIHRFTGTKGKPIDNWNVNSTNLLVLNDSSLIVFNQSAMPVSKIDILEILGNPADFDIYSIALSEGGIIAITGVVQYLNESEKPFICTFNTQGANPRFRYPDKYISSLTYDNQGFLHCMIISSGKIIIDKHSLDLKVIKTVEIPLTIPSLIHPRKLVVDLDGTIWIDDQYNKSNLENPFDLEGDMSLFMRNFKDGVWKSQEIRNLKRDRFATLFLGEIAGRIIMSGVQVSNLGIPQHTPTYGANLRDSEISLSILGIDSEVVIAEYESDGDGDICTLDTQNGDIHISKVEGNRLKRIKHLASLDFQMEGLPILAPFDGSQAFAQAMASPDGTFQSIMRIDLATGKTIAKWLASDYIDLRLLYSCDDNTAVIYWFPNALFKVDEKLNVLAWIDLADEVSFDFLDGAYRDETNYVLDGRYNIVYSFPDSAWTKIRTHSESEVQYGMNYLRESVGNYYAIHRNFPADLNDLIKSGICKIADMDKAFQAFLGESPLYYMGDNFGFSTLIWAKDRDHTLYIVSHEGIEELTR